MKHLLTTAAVLVALAAPAMADELTFVQVGRPQIIENPTHVLTVKFPKYQILVPYVLQYGPSQHQYINVGCSLFADGKLIGTAIGMDQVNNAGGKVRSSSVTFSDEKADSAECSAEWFM